MDFNSFMPEDLLRSSLLVPKKKMQESSNPARGLVEPEISQITPLAKKAREMPDNRIKEISGARSGGLLSTRRMDTVDLNPRSIEANPKTVPVFKHDEHDRLEALQAKVQILVL